MTIQFDEILQAASTAAGLPVPGADALKQATWREGLELLLRDHARANTLSERGESIIKNRYEQTLATRWRVDDYLAKHPQLTQTPVKRPVFILGMPRTGTTLVSNLFDADPANRCFLKWEAYNIVPPAAAGELRSDPRCLAEKEQDAELIKRNPRGAAQHFEAGDGPTECVHLLAQDFKSLMWAVLSTTPTYHDWLLTCDMRSAFAHRKRAYQILQSTNPGRWVFKLPSDSLFIRPLFETFPDAKVIWTHRDPYAAFASSFSMRSNSQGLFNKQPDIEYMRQHFPLQLAMHLSRPLELSRERPADIHHVYYADLVSQPLAQMKKLYSWLGDEWTEVGERRMQAWLAENPQGRFGKHEYNLGQWGFSKEDIAPFFSDYLRAHPVAE